MKSLTTTYLKQSIDVKNLRRTFFFSKLCQLCIYWMLQYRGVIRISTQPRQKYKILTGRKNRFLYTLLISHKRLFHSGTAKKPVYLGSFLLGRIIKIVISSNLQRRPSIFKEFFAWKKNRDFFNQINLAVWAILTVYYM